MTTEDAQMVPAHLGPVERVVGRLVPERTVADIPDAELLGRVVRSITRKRPRRQEFAWVAVMGAFGLGSTYAAQLCTRYGIDPDTGGDLNTPNVISTTPTPTP